MSAPAKRRSPEEIRAAAAHDTHKRIVGIVRGMREAWVSLAADLYNFFDQQMWADLGHESFDSYLADPDVEIGRRWAYELVALYRELVINRQIETATLKAIEPSKLQEVLPAMRRGQVTIRQALADAQSLSRNDIRERYSSTGAGRVNGKPDTTTRYDATSEPQYVRCPTCNSRVREDEIGRL